jgi:carbon monoxide dehydrogenase subunit G
MQIENEFEVAAPPDKVYAFLLDVNQVVHCMPGAELGEVVDPDTFKGRVRIKVGPITVAYNGTARITEKDDAARRAVLSADGRETTGPGSARATATMTVAEALAGSTITLATDYTVAGRVANFGRGVMEDVSRRLVSQMADCIKQHLEAPVAAEPAPDGAAAADGAAAVAAARPAPETRPAPATPVSPPQAKPVNAVSLFFAVLWDRIKRLFGGGRRSSQR